MDETLDSELIHSLLHDTPGALGLTSGNHIDVHADGHIDG
jgi:hypothetical protein